MAIAKVLMTYFRRYITDFNPKIASENCHRIHAKCKLCELCECSSMECKRKLGAGSTGHLTLFARSHGLLDPRPPRHPNLVAAYNPLQPYASVT